MCGICGILGGSTQNAVASMSQALAHRGPDADGIWEGDGIALGHRRLAIIDTSKESDQPFVDTSGDLVMVFNGEIYNYRELRDRLQNHEFRTKSDTEVLLAAYREWGHDLLEHLNGMFAFAIWDLKKKELFIARDRLGIKPLYYYVGNEQFIFASEMRAILASGTIERKLDEDALVDHLRYQSVHAPRTLVKGVKMLMPGHYMIINDANIEERSWWKVNKVSAVDPATGADVKELVRNSFMKAVERRMISDVPFGAFLSGGIDSSLVVGAMSKISEMPIRTFNVSFNEAEFSEAKFANKIAKQFTTDHTEILLKPEDMLDVLPDALNAMDHPSGDGPNTYVVSKVTKAAGVKMALSGLGGDELFAGYDIFRRTLELESKKWIPSFPMILRKFGANVLLRSKRNMASLKIGELLRQGSFYLENTYPISRLTFMDRELIKLLQKDKLPTNAVSQIVYDLLGPESSGAQMPMLSKVSVAEISSYMQNTLLRDSDQMSMAHALEVRVPFLDHELVELALSISDKDKFPNTPKQLLVSAMSEMLPKEIWDRPKMGFVLPWASWMRIELRPLCEEHMRSLAGRSLFHEEEVLDLWRRFLNKDPIMPWSRIWHLVVLEDWLQKNSIIA